MRKKGEGEEEEEDDDEACLRRQAKQTVASRDVGDSPTCVLYTDLFRNGRLTIGH